MTKTLVVFDHATESREPDENFWPAYDAKLRSRVAKEKRASLWNRFTGVKVTHWLPLPLAAALILGVIALGLFWSLHRKANPIPRPSPGDQAVNNVPRENKVDPPQSPVVRELPSNGPVKKSLIAKAPKPQTAKTPGTVANILDPRKEVAKVVPPYAGPMNGVIDSDTARHLEKAQLLLQSFRNTKATDTDGVFDLAYEKRQSQRLLSQNVVLRRSAEAKGNLPAEEMLGRLEPFLIDIANLPDKPAQDDIHSIKERMQKREIVSSLQVYSARTAPPY